MIHGPNHQGKWQLPPSTPKADPEYIARVLAVLHPPGSVVEIRALGIKGRGKPFNASGNFKDFAEAGRAVVDLETRKPDGIYVVLNQVDPSLYSRSQEKITDYPRATTSDRDITRRNWLLADVDPTRPAGISSTDAELDAAEKLAADLRDWFTERIGFLEPLEAMSGNGWHHLYPIDLPNDEDSKTLLENVLKAANAQAERWQSNATTKCKVDTSVFNAARIVKLYGTYARKGCHTDDRPHRRSHLRYVPNHLGWEGQSCGK